MLLLKDIPDEAKIRELAKRYPEMDVSARQAILWLLRTASDAMEGFNHFLAQHEMSQGRFTVLCVLNRDADQTLGPTQLAEKCGVTKATMTGLIDGLVTQGYVARISADGDRRAQHLSLTASGKKLIESLMPGLCPLEKAMMGKLTVSERQTLVRLMQKVRNGLLESRAERAAPRKLHSSKRPAKSLKISKR